MREILTKACSRCGADKPIEDYYWANKARGYKRADCKQCSNKRLTQAKIKWLERNPTKAAEYSRRSRMNNPEACKQKKKRSDDKHRAEIKEYNKEYRDKCPDAYVVASLVHTGFIKTDITLDLIMAKRALIKLTRAIKESV